MDFLRMAFSGKQTWLSNFFYSAHFQFRESCFQCSKLISYYFLFEVSSRQLFTLIATTTTNGISFWSQFNQTFHSLTEKHLSPDLHVFINPWASGSFFGASDRVTLPSSTAEKYVPLKSTKKLV